MAPLVSVNLLLYRPKFYLEPALRSILEQSYDNFELLIIDNDSGDGTAEHAQKIIDEARTRGQKIPPHRIIKNEKNLGFAAAHNLGIRESRGELVALANQDVILDKDFLSVSVRQFGNLAIAAVQGKILRLKVDEENLLKTDIIDTTGLVFLKNRRIIARGQGRENIGQHEKTEEVFGVDGALPVYRRQALEDAKITLLSSVRLRSDEKSELRRGAQIYNRIEDSDKFGEYFDEDFYMYKEDVDLAWRLRLFGWQTQYEPQAVAWHARTAGDSAATGYLGIIRERLKINQFGKYHSFKNQRLMQLKNEQPELLVSHLFYWLPKEIASWVYVILFEHYTWRAIRELFQQVPRAWQKRKIIMARKKIGGAEIKQWFK